ncbi:E3 ubiquitin-protein ligase RNF25 isoform X3 [Falco biarmicus]|uniref:E3 ubiquitin-protein ligase RNF25 isoform X3 n=1 Tax=Falco rusticolus TaxID=120794 RepID=UPI0018868676|nr:E3 ubiquitin-protein ligase RNF25 isoform X3 [Falco rusticolus]XP_055574542.1 E3 ubiquitin-protein ligase RNF25 isoform X3 [Falco cherrug]XP_055668203.1 E3 ubiquitin-protein ligase RNF25 isoform X3 [Falco peregrinus]XP_056206112.1 E3 ubiquitin-protein ligase RNF25 isoform X3 [Falco biarmicus]
MAAAGEEEETTDWALPPEVEVLESIYLEELRVTRGHDRWEPWEISITLHPATAQDQDSQYVRFTLVLSVPPQYPDKAPEISIRNPRGLSDEQIQKISQTLISIAEARLGTEVLYELIEKGKEILTDNNIPHGQCVICLYGFQEREAFTKTKCYHYFHSHCLARYAQHMEEEILMQQEERDQHLVPSPKQEPYRPDAKTLQHQEELRLIFKKQQEKGGIIDPEAERNRYFISLQVPPAAVDPGQAATASEMPVSASAVNVPQLPSQASATEPAGVLETRAEPRRPERPSVPRQQQSKREKHRGERPAPRGQGRQSCSGLQEPAEEACHPLHGSRGARGFSQRPERRLGGRHSQEFPKPHNRSRAAALAERKELCPEDPSPVTEAADLKAEHRDVERWSPEEGAEAQGREMENLAFNRSEHRAAPSWQGHHRPWDCGRWERSRVQERGSYPRAPRGRGAFRPSGQREAHLLEKESGS